jgi:hypothetical protein
MIPKNHGGIHTPMVDKGKEKVQEPTPPDDEVSHLCDRSCVEYEDILGGVCEELPPWQEVNHEINLIDKGKQYQYHLP